MDRLSQAANLINQQQQTEQRQPSFGELLQLATASARDSLQHPAPIHPNQYNFQTEGNRILATPGWSAIWNQSSEQQSLFAPATFDPPLPPPNHPFQPQQAFTLPPTTTVFNDVNQAISNTTAPPAFYSSYGLYQPIQGPYARFLTPSPEPSVLGELEFELDLVGGGMWGNRTENTFNSLESTTVADCEPRPPTFSSYSGYNNPDWEANTPVAGPSSSTAIEKKPKKPKQIKKSKLSTESTQSNDEFHPGSSNNTNSSDKQGVGKKNRNPHATQLPSNGVRKMVKEEPKEGFEGPVCTHCGSIQTPLWRRGPQDELLCNASVSRSCSRRLI